MTREEWPDVKRLLLQWPQPRAKPIDDGAYLRLLRRFPVEQVAGAVDSMLGVNEHTPLASEIAAHIRASGVEPTSGPPPTIAAELSRFDAKIANGCGIFNRSSPEVQAQVMADIGKQHGKLFVKRSFPGWKPPGGLSSSVEAPNG